MTSSNTALPEGFKRGCLAGLSESERAKKVAKFASKATVADVETAVQVLAGQAIRHEPVDSFETILSERSLEELRVMALDYGLPQQTVERIGHDDVITMIASAARNDKRDCELAFESCSAEQRASLRKLLDAGGRIEFDIEDAAKYTDIRVFPPYTFLYIHEDRFTYLVCDVFLENLRAVDQKKTDAARKTVEDIVAACSALVELCGVVESHTAYDFFKRWYPEDSIEFAEFARDVVREAATQHYDFVCWNNGVHDYLLHFSLEDPATNSENPEAEDAERLSLAEYRAQLIERHETIPVFDCGRKVAEQGVPEWKQTLPEVVALRNFLDAHVPEGENEYVFADRVVEELLFSSMASLDSQRALGFLNEKGLGPVLKADDTLIMLVTAVMRSLPSWDYNGYAPHGERAYTAESANKTVDASGNTVKVGRNDPCPCGSGKKYKKCCGANK